MTQFNGWQIPFLLDHHKEQSSGTRMGGKMMSGSRLSVKASPHSMDFLMDTGNPALNAALDGVLKISGVRRCLQSINLPLN